MNKKRSFYGWVVAACCTMLAFSVNAMGNNALSFYVAPISESLGISRVTINFALFTMGLLTRTACGFFFGKLAERFGIRRLMVIGLGFVLLGFTAYYFADNIVMIGIGSALYGVAHAIGTLSSYNVIINGWFIKSKGLVLGILNTAVGVGGMVINPLAGTWIQQHGWNQSFLNTALLIAVIAIPALILVKESPREMGQMPYGAQDVSPPKPADVDAPASSQEPVLTLRGAFRVERFWLLVIAQLLIGLSVGPCFTNSIPALYAIGVDTNLISKVLSVFLAFGITIGNITSGLLYDRFGLGMLMNVAVAIVGAGMACMGYLTGDSSALLLVFTVVCIGYGNALSLGTLSHMINNVFASEKKDFSGLFGCLFAVQNIGIMIGSPISGMIYDKTGSYHLAYQIAMLLLIMVLFVLHGALRIRKRKAEIEQPFSV